MQKITLKKALIAGAAIFAILILVMIIRSCKNGSKDLYEYDAVSIGPISRTISVTGILEVPDSYRVLGKTAGTIQKVYVDFNDNVRKGQALAALDGTEIEQRLQKIAAQLESVKLEQENAAEDLEGKKSMFKDGLISDKGLEKAQNGYKAVVLKAKQIQIDYNMALRARNDAVIYSPVNGIVISRDIEVNYPVIPNQPLFTIAGSLSKMRLTISIDESDIGQIKKGQHVSFTVSTYPDRTFNATIHQVRMNPIVKGGLVTYQAVVMCDNEDLMLKPGMTATTTVEISRKEAVLRVPNQAFIVAPTDKPSDITDKSVWRKSSRASGGVPVEKVPVEIGLKGDKFTEIKKNLNRGDMILVKFTKNKKK